MDANFLITSELVDGALLHPSLPMSYLGEVIDIPGNNYATSYTFNFKTLNFYTGAFFILTTVKDRSFYHQVTGSGNSFSIYFMRKYKTQEGQYTFYQDESVNGQITKPMLEGAKLYVGGIRG